MSEMTGLERRYRGLLALYPQAFRDEHEQDMLSVLLTEAEEGRQRPAFGEYTNLIGHAMWTRLRNPTSWESRHHPWVWVVVRALIGLWLIVLTGLLCASGQWWGLALLPFAVLHFGLAQRLANFAADQPQPPITRQRARPQV